MYSTSTNNLEKAYDDLEKEIREIKMRLEGSQGPSGSIEQMTGGSTQKHQSMDKISGSVSGASHVAGAYVGSLGRSDRDVRYQIEPALTQSAGSTGLAQNLQMH